MAVAVQREEEPADDVEHRHVVVPRHHELRRWQPPEVRRGRRVLLAPRALGEVAADDQNGRRREALQILHEPLHHRRVDPVEVEVGDVGDGPHATSTLLTTELLCGRRPHTETMKSLMAYTGGSCRGGRRPAVIGAFEPDTEFGPGVAAHTRLSPGAG